MATPDWRTSRASTRVRVALWLATEIGEDGVFSKAQLRDAFPSVEQIDRRMRDLRNEGWVISTYREDRSLRQDTLRLLRVGGRVWEEGYRTEARRAVSDKERQAVLAADGYACVVCGITGGEAFVDDPVRTAKLTIQRLSSVDDRPRLRTVCDRCHAGTKGSDAAADLPREIDELSDAEREQLRSWIRRSSRPASRVERVWRLYQQSPTEDRAQAAARLDALDR